MAFYAGRLCITTRYLANIVRSRYGKSPKEAIDTYTVMQIRLDLLQSDIPLTDLAYKYNFSSPSFFSDYFRRNAGCGPQEYRLANKTLDTLYQAQGETPPHHSVCRRQSGHLQGFRN